MSDYVVHIASPAAREIKKLIRQAQVQVTRTLEKLADNPRPHGAEKLRSRPSYYRIRSGDFRLIYAVRDDVAAVIVLVVRDRKDAFKGLEELDAKLADALVKVADSILEQAAIHGSA